MKNVVESLLKKTVGSRRYAEEAAATHVDKSDRVSKGSKSPRH